MSRERKQVQLEEKWEGEETRMDRRGTEHKKSRKSRMKTW